MVYVDQCNWYLWYIYIYLQTFNLLFIIITLQWRHDERDGVTNHQRLDSLLNLLFRGRSKETSELPVTGLCEGNSPLTDEFPAQHYSDVIMNTKASQITSLAIVYSIVYSGADQRKPSKLRVTGGIHQRPVKSPHKGPVKRKIFPFDDVIMKGPVTRKCFHLKTSSWTNNFHGHAMYSTCSMSTTWPWIWLRSACWEWILPNFDLFDIEEIRNLASDAGI